MRPAMTALRPTAPVHSPSPARNSLETGDSRPQPGDRPGILTGSGILVLVLVIAALGFLPWGRGAAARELAADGRLALPEGPLTFDDVVRIAIHQSPYLTKSSLEVEIRRLDETDSRFGLLPSLTFRTVYYVNRPDFGYFTPKPYSLSFATDPYNPIGSYFTLQAQKLATKIAVQMHLKLISEGLQRLGKMFLQLETLKQVAAYQSQLVNLARERLTYVENRLSIGTASPLEVKVAAQELQLAQAEKERMLSSQKRALRNLQTYLGLKGDRELRLDLKNAPRQVLGDFNPSAATVDQAKSRSPELKALELKKQIQGYIISQAKSRLLPTILFTLQNPNPLSLSNTQGLYAGVGVEVPVWDGFNRLRNITRQKTVLKQIGSEKEVKESDLEDKWQGAQEEIQHAAEASKMAQSRQELALLKERQAEIHYDSGEGVLPDYLEGRKLVLEAKKHSAMKSMEHSEALLSLRQLSGDLGHSYVAASSWQE